MNSALLISHDVVGTRMAGPGIRYYNLARALAPHVHLTLAIPDESPTPLSRRNGRGAGGEGVNIVRYTRRDWPSLQPHTQGKQVLIFPSDIASDMPAIAHSEACLVIDGYDPLLAEWLFIEARHDVATQQAHWRDRMIALSQQYLIGDFYLCASERQRDWWLGLLEAHGRINAHTFRQDQTLRALIDVVPFGLSAAPPIKTQPAIKGVWDGIAAEDKLLLWGGGLWPWLDPLTAIRAMNLVSQKCEDVRLVFPGTKHPNPLLGGMRTKAEDAKELAAQLGLINTHVFFGDWVPYEAWPDVLLESDAALSLHEDTLEARLAFRSRMLEYIWAGLPTVATTGDATSDLIAQHDLGLVVGYHDDAGVADAILRVLDEPRPLRGPQFERAQQALTWERVAAPLIAFCQNPQRAADRASSEMLGNPLYMQAVQALRGANQQAQQAQAETTHWRELVGRYERGKFMRLMKWLKGK
jgi:glycosyltransferase involved in cell wall biosynthesis